MKNRKVLLIPVLAMMLGGCDKIVNHLIPKPAEESAAPQEEKQEERRKERKFIYQFLSIFLHVAFFRSYTPIKVNFRKVPDLR